MKTQQFFPSAIYKNMVQSKRNKKADSTNKYHAVEERGLKIGEMKRQDVKLSPDPKIYRPKYIQKGFPEKTYEKRTK